MDIKKRPIFRVQIRDINTRHMKVLTIYSDGEPKPTLEEFKQKIIKAIKSD